MRLFKLQYSVRSILLLVAATGIATWYWQFHVVAEREHKTAVRLLFDAPDEWWDGPHDKIGDPISVVRSVNHLRRMGKRRAIVAMRSFAHTHPDRAGTLNNVIPLLFDPPSGECEFDWFWNQHDIFVVNDLAFHGNFYRSGAAIGYQPKLLDWVEEHGEIRDSPMVPPDNPFSSAEQALRNLKQTDWGSAWIRDDRLAGDGTIDRYFYLQMIHSTYHLSSTGKPFDFSWAFSNDTQNRKKWEQYKSDLLSDGIYWNQNKMKYLTRGSD